MLFRLFSYSIFSCWLGCLFTDFLERDKTCFVDDFLSGCALHVVDEVEYITFGPAVCEHVEVT